ncbi:MAG: DNA-3-methyladenine glycosylase I [Paracoccaceae bacterium]
MKTFANIREIADQRKGREFIDAHLPPPPATPLIDQRDDRLLSEFSKRVFQAGFNWQVVEDKWPGFERAFHGFDIARNAMMSDEDLDRLLADTGIIRHGAKILSVRDNAVFLSDLARVHGSAAAGLGAWPREDTVGLFHLLKTRGSRLGGVSAQYALRSAGYDCFILSRSVVAALNMAGAIDGPATSKSALARVQEAFNRWHEESGETYTRMSRVLAFSVPD